MERRGFLRVLGGGVIAAATSGHMSALASPTDDPAAPWASAASQGGDIRRRALAFAILAPNPHNRQPWLVELDMTDSVTLYCDQTRLLPVTDPFGRQILIGLGAFIETFAIAAANDGRATEVALFPDGYPENRVDARPVARLRLAGPTPPDPLFPFILRRRSVKTPYDMAREVPAAAVAALVAAPRAGVDTLKVVTESSEVAVMRDFMSRAGEIEVMTPRTWQESVDLMRIGRAENLANPDGISMTGPFIEKMLAEGKISRSIMADTSHPAFKAGAERWVASTAATPAALWFSTPGNTRDDQIAAGRAWMRIALTAVDQGLSLHPMSQVLQEFPEMAAEYAAFHAHAGVKTPARVQMLARLGYGPTVGPTPRWPLATRIKPS
jgi:hypothetical protein